jgi:hypothetical protein
VLKNVSIGVVNYVRDKLNIFDALLVTLGLIEYFLSTGSGFTAFRSLRVFRVLRVTRLIRSLKYMRVIMRVISSTLKNSIYIGLLLLLFLFIFTILGMSIYSNAFDKVSGINKPLRENYNDFIHGFFVTF